MVEAFGVAVADSEIPGDQSSTEIERILHWKPGTLEQFVKDNLVHSNRDVLFVV